MFFQSLSTLSDPIRLSYTGGSDSVVRIWNMDKDQYQEPELAYEADEGITALASTVSLSPLTRPLPSLTRI